MPGGRKGEQKESGFLMLLAEEKRCHSLISEHPELFELLHRPLKDFQEMSDIDLTSIEPSTALGILGAQGRRKGRAR